jgi:hypothetical protein
MGTMGRLATGNRRYSLQRLNQVHKEILRRHFVGQKAVEIAAELNLSPVTVSYTINNPLAKEMLQDLDAGADASVQDVPARIREIAIDAVEVLNEMVIDKGTPPALRLRAATDVLDRAGHGAVKKVEGRVAHGYFTSDEISRLVAEAKAAAGKGPIRTEVPCTVVEEEAVMDEMREAI